MRTIPGYPNKLVGTAKITQIVYSVVHKLPFLPSSRRYNITVCHEKKFMWFRVAKVGTRTIYHHLLKSHIHLDAEHPYRLYYPTNIYSNYFKFAFVRNPWDRLVSCWHNKVIDSNYFKFSDVKLTEMKTFANFVNFLSGLDIENCDPHLRLQCRLIDLNHIDYLGRLESLGSDLSKIFHILDIPLNDIEPKNVSPERIHYHEYFDPALAEKVYQIYRRDIQIFGYNY